ncbi:hypothetical protein GSS87_01270 [Corynebacterium sp. 4HC-13]|nr:hypothetical protein [Corynebacterium anserum]
MQHHLRELVRDTRVKDTT